MPELKPLYTEEAGQLSRSTTTMHRSCEGGLVHFRTVFRRVALTVRCHLRLRRFLKAIEWGSKADRMGIGWASFRPPKRSFRLSYLAWRRFATSIRPGGDLRIPQRRVCLTRRLVIQVGSRPAALWAPRTALLIRNATSHVRRQWVGAFGSIFREVSCALRSARTALARQASRQCAAWATMQRRSQLEFELDSLTRIAPPVGRLSAAGGEIGSSGVKVRIRLLLAGLPYGSLRDFFLGVHDQKKTVRQDSTFDTYASALPSIGRQQTDRPRSPCEITAQCAAHRLAPGFSPLYGLYRASLVCGGGWRCCKCIEAAEATNLPVSTPWAYS